jgi:hypothetical protein
MRRVQRRVHTAVDDFVIDFESIAAARLEQARAMLIRCIRSTLPPTAMRWRQLASYWTRKAPCLQTRTIPT